MVKKKSKMKKLAALFSVILLLATLTCLSAFAEGGEAKIGETEYATLAEALDAVRSSNETVTLLKDAVYEEPKTVERRGIIDGAGHRLTLKNRIYIGGKGNLTLRNITVDLSRFSEATNKQDAFAFYSNTLTFEAGTIITGANNNLNNVVKAADAAVFNMTGGSIEDCTVNNAVVCVTGNGNARATISGGSIKNNAVADERGGVYLEKGTLTITGNPEITGNHKKDATTPFNVNIKAGTTFNVEAPFTGKIGVRYNNLGEAGTEIGNAGAGLTLSADSIVLDRNSAVIGYVSGGKVILKNKLTLTPVTSKGKYVAADSSTCGVVRVNTTVTGITDAVTLEKVGTYFYKTTDNGKTASNTVEIDPTNVANGHGYMADVYHIDDPTATVFAVNFYKLQGIDGYIFSALEEPIEYNVNAVQFVDYTEAE